ncbi:MAG TPA: nuclear transport factor 2 family protein [Duganella sp.]|uniref:nuclear transport factor 2 family protein n=1 Tax=Duganella sp. TaxID=1904440 RepID=UPI002ED3C8FA
MDTNLNAVEIARAYVNAMAAKDVEAVLSLAADDVVCTSPMGKIAGIGPFRGFQEGFAKMIKKLSVLAVHGDEHQAVIVYNAETHPVPNSIVAELIKAKDGKLITTEVIYDATPFLQYMKTVQAH